MSNVKEATADAGDEVVRAIGELGATAKDAAKAATEAGVDHEEVKGWLIKQRLRRQNVVRINADQERETKSLPFENYTELLALTFQGVEEEFANRLNRSFPKTRVFENL